MGNGETISFTQALFSPRSTNITKRNRMSNSKNLKLHLLDNLPFTILLSQNQFTYSSAMAMALLIMASPSSICSFVTINGGAQKI